MTTQTKQKQAPRPKSNYRLWSFFDPKNSQHRNILSLCMQYGWGKPHANTGKIVADLSALDKWLRGKYKSGNSPIQKPLNDMNKQELSKVIFALEQMTLKKYK